MFDGTLPEQIFQEDGIHIILNLPIYLIVCQYLTFAHVILKLIIDEYLHHDSTVWNLFDYEYVKGTFKNHIKILY